MQQISFPSEAANVGPSGVTFAALVGDARVVCVVSRDALQEHFELREIDGPGAIGMFDVKRRRIESVARGKILDGGFEPDGSVLLRSVDFWI
jgi:hypothetical protein